MSRVPSLMYAASVRWLKAASKDTCVDRQVTKSACKRNRWGSMCLGKVQFKNKTGFPNQPTIWDWFLLVFWVNLCEFSIRVEELFALSFPLMMVPWFPLSNPYLRQDNHRAVDEQRQLTLVDRVSITRFTLTVFKPVTDGYHLFVAPSKECDPPSPQWIPSQLPLREYARCGERTCSKWRPEILDIPWTTIGFLSIAQIFGDCFHPKKQHKSQKQKTSCWHLRCSVGKPNPVLMSKYAFTYIPHVRS